MRDQLEYNKHIKRRNLTRNMICPSKINKMTKQDVLPNHLQSIFRSLASKANVLAATVRPDFTYAAKFLTTRYGKATK